MSKRRNEFDATIPAFRVHHHADLGKTAAVWRNGDFFMGDLAPGAAKRLAALLNEATDLADLLADRGGVEHARTKLAFAVAKAMGRTIDFSEAPVTGVPLL